MSWSEAIATVLLWLLVIVIGALLGAGVGALFDHWEIGAAIGAGVGAVSWLIVGYLLYETEFENE